MAKILGKYILRASLEDFTTGFTFTGANRQTVLNLGSSTMLSFDCSDIKRNNDTSALSFNSNAVLKIRRARIVTTGAAGLRSALGYKAAQIFLTAHDSNDIASDALGNCCVSLDNYNEWENVNVDFMPWTHSNENYFMAASNSIGLQNAFLSVDDFNVQADYVGQTFKPYLEIEVDTAGGMFNIRQEIV